MKPWPICTLNFLKGEAGSNCYPHTIFPPKFNQDRPQWVFMHIPVYTLCFTPSPVINFPVHCTEPSFGGLWFCCSLSLLRPDVYSPEYLVILCMFLLNQGRSEAGQEWGSGFLLPRIEGELILELPCGPTLVLVSTAIPPVEREREERTQVQALDPAAER